jgi:hypothetical protein
MNDPSIVSVADNSTSSNDNSSFSIHEKFQGICLIGYALFMLFCAIVWSNVAPSLRQGVGLSATLSRLRLSHRMWLTTILVGMFIHCLFRIIYHRNIPNHLPMSLILALFRELGFFLQIAASVERMFVLIFIIPRYATDELSFRKAVEKWSNLVTSICLVAGFFVTLLVAVLNSVFDSVSIPFLRLILLVLILSPIIIIIAHRKNNRLAIFSRKDPEQEPLVSAEMSHWWRNEKNFSATMVLLNCIVGVLCLAQIVVLFTVLLKTMSTEQRLDALYTASQVYTYFYCLWWLFIIIGLMTLRKPFC